MEKALSSRHLDAGGTSTTYKPGCIVFMQPISLVQYMGKQVLPQRFHIYISILPMSSHKLLGNFPAADPNLLDNVLPSLWWEPVHHIKGVMCSHSILYLLSHTHSLSRSFFHIPRPPHCHTMDPLASSSVLLDAAERQAYGGAYSLQEATPHAQALYVCV